MSKKRTLVVFADSYPASQLAAIERDEEPRVDMLDLAQRVGADLLTFDSFRADDLPADEGRYPGLLRLGEKSRDLAPFPEKIRRSQKLLWKIAKAAYEIAADYDSVFFTGEDLALPFAAISSVRGRRTNVAAIGHYLHPLKKALPLDHRLLGRFIDKLIVYSPRQHLFATERLRFPEAKVELIPFHADASFYRPAPVPRIDRDLVVAAGFERRDYATLFAAMDQGGFRLELGVGSPWSRYRRRLPELPSWANNAYRTRRELRELYQQALAVVVPLVDTEFQAGISVVTEAMACGARVVVTRTRGLSHLLHDGVDGIYVPPGNPRRMRDVLQSLRFDELAPQRLSENARQAILDSMSTNHFVHRLSWIIEATGGDSRSAQFYIVPSASPLPDTIGAA